MLTGYMHPAYVQSLSESGTPKFLPQSGAWILERQIPGWDYVDAIGCYPIFVCQDWSQLEIDLEDVRDTLLSLAVVTDPFGEYNKPDLSRCFPDLVRPFKQHFVVDLSRPSSTFIDSHHRRYACKALREVRVERCADPLSYLDDWTALYDTLIKRHLISGITAFSRDSFAKQLSVPGLVAFKAVNEGTTVGMLLWYLNGKVAYYHLGAYSARGYDLRASFALFSYAIEYFAQSELRSLNLGGEAGAENNATSGLTRFKQGWATGTRTAYLCGRIFDQQKYREILKSRALPGTKYFPAYRAGEFR